MTATAPPRLGDCEGRILVVDDQEPNRVLLGEILETHGYEAIAAANGTEAIARVADADPDLILLDVNMPELDGLEVCRRIRANPDTATLPIILVTALVHRDHRLQGIAAGANDYLTKPVDRADLLLRVHNNLQIRKLHAELAHRYAELLRLEQMRDTLVHMLVHDFRSPLAGIMGYLEIIRETIRDIGQSELLDDIEEMGRSIRTLAHMVSNVLDVSRFEAQTMPLDLRSADLNAIVADAVAGLGRIHGAPVAVNLAPGPVLVTADPDLLARVVANLVGNAIKFTPRQGSITVNVSSGTEGATVKVIDTGPGIAAEHHVRIFDKFAQVDGTNGTQRQSSGLGLTFCKLAVDAHGGRIGLDSAPGQGSTFWFSLRN